MRPNFFANLASGLPATIAIVILLLFSSAGRTKEESNKDTTSVEAKCCFGYKITMNQLRRFILDSLGTDAFEGGIYSKKDLLAAINSMAGDSVYLMNAWLDCVLNEGTGMFITSPTTGKVHLVSRYRPYCHPCPGSTCCPQAICASKINRTCLTYRRLTAPEETTARIDVKGTE